MAKGASAVCEIRPTVGSDTAGGLFDSTIAGAGTDFTQQNNPQLTVTDAVGNGTTTITSTTGGFTAAMIGNALFQNGDSDRYFITGVTNTNTITVDRATGTWSSKTLSVGGALATLNEAFSARGGVGSNFFHVKNTGQQNLASTILTPPGGTGALPTVVKGYNVTRGDLDFVSNFTNHPVIQCTSGVATSYIFSDTNGNVNIKNFVLDANNVTNRCYSKTISFGMVDNCLAKNFLNNGFYINGNGVILNRCWATAGAAGASNAAFQCDVQATLCYCVAFNNACAGFLSNAVYQCTLIGCLAAGNTTVNGHGLKCGANSPVFLDRFVAYNNGGDGINLVTVASNQSLTVRNAILALNAGFGFNSPGTMQDAHVDYVAYFNNTSGARRNLTAGPHDVTLTADPFLNGLLAIAAFSDIPAAFGLNNVVGGGLSCQGAGFNWT